MIDYLVNIFKKKRYKVLGVSRVTSQNVSKGLKHRNKLNNQTIIQVGNKFMIYSQWLDIERKGKSELVQVKLKQRKVRTKIEGRTVIQAVLKTYKKGDTVRM